VSRLLERVETSIRKHRLIEPGETCLVAVSGGVDSMVLLHLLNALAVRHGWKLAVAHFNHRLRGKSSDADESLVRKTAKRLGLRFVSATGEVKKFAMAGGLSVEMAARKLRHEFLAKAAARLKIRKVAFAHHADDQVELFFLRLLRGSGGEGLAGMKWRSRSPVDAGIELIRPLLNEHKTWLRAYALDGGIAFREDGSNDSLDIQRNRIRHELLPLLREKYQPALDRTILRAAELIHGDAEHTAVVAREWLEVFRNGRAGQRFEQLPVAVQRQAIYIQMLELGIVPDFESVEKLRCEPDVPIGLGGRAGVRVKRDEAASMAFCRLVRDGKGKVSVKSVPKVEFRAGEISLELAGKGETTFSGVNLRWEQGYGRKRPLQAPQTEWFDADEVGKAIVVRHWRRGDRFQPIGMKKAVKLQDFFTNEKVSRGQRHELIVAQTVQGEVFWVEGLRIAERFKLTEGTIRRLKWRWHRP
jgi:tRNA(Ile)-lysidine synthase